MEGGHAIPESDREGLARRRYGSLDKIPSSDGKLWDEYQETVVAQGRARGLQVKKLCVDTGDSLIWHPQLPHGGSPIRDQRRTQFSLVMHITPVGVPVYQQNVFFNPSKEFSETADWSYREVDGRMIADFRNGVSFGHKRDYALDQFRPA